MRSEYDEYEETVLTSLQLFIRKIAYGTWLSEEDDRTHTSMISQTRMNDTVEKGSSNASVMIPSDLGRRRGRIIVGSVLPWGRTIRVRPMHIWVGAIISSTNELKTGFRVGIP